MLLELPNGEQLLVYVLEMEQSMFTSVFRWLHSHLYWLTSV